MLGRAVALVVVAACAASLLHAILQHPDRLSLLPSLQVDAAAYHEIAVALARSADLSAIPPLQPPGFVTLIAGIYQLFGVSFVVAHLTLWVVWLLVIALGARLAVRVHSSEAAGWWAAILIASAPALQAYSGTVQYELVAALWLLVLLAMVEWARGGAIGRWAIVGLLAAAATLTREVFVATLPVLACCAFLLPAGASRVFAAERVRSAGAQGRTSGVHWLPALALLLCALLPLAAWARLQSTRAGRVVAVSDKGPLVMAFGNNPFANGTFNAPLVGVGEPAGVAFVRQHPARTGVLAVRKFGYFWGLLRDGWNVPRRGALFVARASGGLVPLPWILPFARGGWILAFLVTSLLLWSRERWRGYWHLPVLIGAIMSVHLVTVSSHRFAVPVLPAALVIVAGPIALAAARGARSRRIALVALALLVAAVLMQAREWPVRYGIAAVDTDGRDAENRREGDERVRVATVARGVRPVLLLGDEALPRGTFTVDLEMRAAETRAGTVAHVRAQLVDGTPLCERAVSGADLQTAAWTTIRTHCALTRDAPVTLLVETTAVTDLAFRGLSMEW